MLILFCLPSVLVIMILSARRLIFNAKCYACYRKYKCNTHVIENVFMNEYGMNPFKKNLKGDHVFLTGAGSGIGQGMAVKLGKLGCKLSLSDINMEGLR